MEVDTVVFDVIGTVVDEASIAEDLASVLEPDIAAATGRRWAEGMDRRLDEIRDGRAPWRSNEAVRREALHEALTGDAHLNADQLTWLQNAGRRLRPWPDSSAALRELGERFKLVALSNATLAELAEISVRGRLAWHAVLSGALVKAYKPSSQVYSSPWQARPGAIAHRDGRCPRMGSARRRIPRTAYGVHLAPRSGSPTRGRSLRSLSARSLSPRRRPGTAVRAPRRSG